MSDAREGFGVGMTKDEIIFGGWFWGGNGYR